MLREADTVKVNATGLEPPVCPRVCGNGRASASGRKELGRRFHLKDAWNILPRQHYWIDTVHGAETDELLRRFYISGSFGEMI